MSDNEAFLDAIRAAPNDVATRLVYADWLDEHGHAGGEFLRAECEWIKQPYGPQKQECFARLQEAGVDLEQDWLATVSRVPIENCVEFEFECRRRWDRLQITSDATVRYCETCRQNVTYCCSIEEAQNLAGQRKCVAVDSRLARKPDDLHPFTGMLMGRLITPLSRRR